MKFSLGPIRKFDLNNVRLRGKMLILYFLSVFIPIVLTNIIFYEVTTHNIKKQKIKDISLAMEQVRNDFLTQINTAVGISSVLYTDSLLNGAMEKNYNSALDYVESYDSNISGTLNKYSPVYNAIKNITIYTNNPTIVQGGGVLSITDQIRQTDWYKKVMQSHDSTPIIMRTTVQTYNGSSEVYSVIRKLDYFNDSSRQKILKIDMDMGTIQDVFHNVTLQGFVYLVNDRNIIQYTSNPRIPWLSKSVLFTKVKLPHDALKFEQHFYGVSYLSGWKIIGEFSVANVLKDVYKSRRFVLYLAVLNILIPTLIIIWIARSMNIRLVRVLRHVKRVKNHHFEVIQHEHYTDEIGQLTEEFNRMILQIRQLINDVYLADIQKKDLLLKQNQAQLHALQSQINPHFLFNALETIRMRSLMKGEGETAKIIQNMAKIFRKSLNWEKDWVSVEEEINLILSFLEIQKYRFGDKLGYEIFVDDVVRRQKIPHMSVLPFIENACIHGIELLKGKGRIELRFETRGPMIRYSVTDNGIGMSEKQLKRIRKDLLSEESMGSSIGIKNVYYRLKLYYGDLFHFEMDSSSDKGTSISVSFPAGNDHAESGGSTSLLS